MLAAFAAPGAFLIAEATALTWHVLFQTVEGIVAVGTLALAVGTVVLAVMTRKMAKETRDLAGSTAEEIELTRTTAEDLRRQTAATESQAAVARDALAATFRPVLVSVSEDFEFMRSETHRYVNGPDVEFGAAHRWLVNITESEKHLHFSLPVRNVGQGVAFITSAVCRVDNAIPDLAGRAVNAIVPPNETTRLSFSVAKLDATGGAFIQAMLRLGCVSVQVVYADLSSNVWETRLDLYRTIQDSKRWYVRQVFVKAWGAADGAVGSGPMFEP